MSVASMFQRCSAAVTRRASARSGVISAAVFPGAATEPVWLSSGTADYFHGIADAAPSRPPLGGVIQSEPGRFAAYRLHEEDPLPFTGGLRLVWSNGEERHGHRHGDPQPTTLTAYVWTYEWE